MLAAPIPVHIWIWNPGKVEAPTNVATLSTVLTSIKLRWKEDFISCKASNLSMVSAPAQVNSHFRPCDAFGSIWTDPGLAFLPSRYHSRYVFTTDSQDAIFSNCPSVIIALPSRFENSQLQFGGSSVLATSKWASQDLVLKTYCCK